MRLIRLTTKDLTGYVDADFNQDVIIEPNSKIALHSLTSQFNRFELIINAQNDKIKFSVDGDGAIRFISLPNGIWNNATMANFFTLATVIFNKTMEYTKRQLGRQWYIGTAENRFTFQCMAGTIIAPPITSTMKFVKTVNVSPNTDYGVGAYQRSGGTTSQHDAFMYLTSTQCKGSASFRAKYKEDIDPELSGFILAYRTEPVSAQTTLIEQSTITYGIRLVDPTQPYKIILNGLETAITGVLPVVNDTLAIDTYGGNIYLRIYREAGNVVNLLYTGTYDHITNYFPVAVFVGETVMNTIRFTSDYFYNNTNPPGEVDNTLEANNNLPTLSLVPATQNFLEFDDPLLAQELGFKQYRYPLTGYNTEVNSIYTGENGFKLRDFSESYIIEMLNLNIDSYDSQSKQHRNFLAVVPQVSQVREEVVYIAPNLIFLDINNAFPLIMRQFKARVLKEDLSAINTYGLTQITILIKGPNE
jgi:hypothetical protein